MLDIVRKKTDKEIEVRILIGMDKPTKERDVEWLREYPRIELRYLNKSIQTSLTTIVTDRELSLVIEERKDGDDFGLQRIQIVNQQFYPVPQYLRIYGHSQLLVIHNNKPRYEHPEHRFRNCTSPFQFYLYRYAHWLMLFPFL